VKLKKGLTNKKHYFNSLKEQKHKLYPLHVGTKKVIRVLPYFIIFINLPVHQSFWRARATPPVSGT
jgi:hypothetical protein